MPRASPCYSDQVPAVMQATDMMGVQQQTMQNMPRPDVPKY